MGDEGVPLGHHLNAKGRAFNPIPELVAVADPRRVVSFLPAEWTTLRRRCERAQDRAIRPKRPAPMGGER